MHYEFHCLDLEKFQHFPVLANSSSFRLTVFFKQEENTNDKKILKQQGVTDGTEIKT